MKPKIDRSRQVSYDYHLPVLLHKAVDYLVTTTDGIYIDGTLGGGGHAAEILRKLNSGGNLYAFDKDKEAREHCNVKFREELDKGEDSRIKILNESFSSACSIKSIRGKISGILLDLGVSSRQLDSGSRGFTYREKTELDMRFSDKGDSAEAILNTSSEEELTRILRDYGEEPFAKAIARRITESRRAALLETTYDLRDVILSVVPPSLKFKSLSRSFQAIRIAVNNELTELEDTLNDIIPFLAPGGRIVVISYHSLEDRIVKNIFKSNTGRSSSSPQLKILTSKPIIPNEEEILANPRARSAKMRVAEKLK